jgi:ectoine hydroxylase-related dioxygenase (phytanoyl-CoA dioxygenase family)
MLQLTDKKIEDIQSVIKEQGYYILENAITPDACDRYKRLLEQDCKKYSSYYKTSVAKTAHGLENKSSEKIVFNLHNKNIAYYELIENPDVLAILDRVLKDGSYMNAEPYVLGNNSARCPLANSKGQQLHIDSRLPGGDFPIAVIALWMLDDFTEENGATRIVPKSHKFTTYPDQSKKYDDEKVVTAPRGSVLIYNGSLWHGSSDKKNADDRWSVILTYVKWFIKPSFDFMQNMPAHIFNQLTDKQKELLGYKCTPPKDEFTRMRRLSDEFDIPAEYKLPV